jgi:DNA/RNA-binding domain of Phe-tRNA-synthetase-like protein
MTEHEQILKTEWSDEFDILAKNRMIVSYHKYGPVKENYGGKLASAIENLEKRLELYRQTGNTEYLVDVRNFAMIEFMFPQHPNAHFNEFSKSPGLGGMTYRDIEGLGL